ncbi:uncharacterized protein EI90DRAFT_206089 [Cantharellus anzutake]|uniref:uncharacterized protein n=1 Tax=Cantharellus anzutake TaxID=1750568 RepID=UPI00190512DF|nr:uncharacterized protein EI90DRAFT_464840 [Cantharellus anzutake]XP_038919461.1 uncharacterized protein EI90DRAFT_206089 [Cantharellus anzutake]KAF8314359.1 hypothetical protein EI90DRAFT_464840 [Cantharellus anzutake]KAF8336648.1 hypothetical protein EI90DRAFT_206089 [Cantharellus anzutake]
MCMWCLATQNLQRPELDWPAYYPLLDERDSLLLKEKETPVVASPPFTYIHAMTARKGDGSCWSMVFSPENDAQLESLVYAYQAGRCPLRDLTVHVHVSLLDPYALQPSSPRDACFARRITPRFVNISTSAMNLRYIYPQGVLPSNYMTRLKKPSDVWKALNPLLCRPGEMPKLLILRNCKADPTYDGLYPRNKCLHDGPLTSGTFDIGAVDYRGHFDFSHGAWFFRRFPKDARRSLKSEEDT